MTLLFFLMDSSIKKFVFAFAVLFSAAYAKPSSDSCHFPAMFNFGDSNSDTGTNATAFEPYPSPFGISFFGEPSKRMCDGRLMIDFMTESLGFPYMSSILDSVESDFSHGINFACAGAAINTQDYSPFTMWTQYNQFSTFLRKSKVLTNRNVFKELFPNPQAVSHALFTVDIGENDIIANELYDMSPNEMEENIIEIVKNWTGFIKGLYDNGARSFWIHNIGPVGCLPAYVAYLNSSSPRDEAGCSKPVNEVVGVVNGRLKEAVDQLRKDCPLAVITFVDMFRAKHTLIKEAQNHGFENPFLVCCGHGGEYNYDDDYPCGGILNEQTKERVGACKNPATRIFWDGFHYTEAANKWLFNHIADGSFSDPPLPLTKTCHMQDYSKRTEL